MIRPRIPFPLGVLLLGVLLLETLAGPAALSAQATHHHRGTATIDGVESAGEWAGAEAATVPLTLPAGLGGGTFDVTFLLMNDDDNLYLALRFPYGSSPPSPAVVYLTELAWRDGLDRCDPATLLDLHQSESQDGVATYWDLFEHATPECWRTIGADDQDGGTTDGSGAWVADGSTTFFEIGHPLDSGDSLHDLSATLGERIQLDLVALGCDATSFCAFPAELEPRIFLEPEGFVFLGDFESGDTAGWSAAQPN